MADVQKREVFDEKTDAEHQVNLTEEDDSPVEEVRVTISSMDTVPLTPGPTNCEVSLTLII